MRNIRQIRGKVTYLKRKLIGKPSCENFGGRAQLLLSQYIGDVYQYSYKEKWLIGLITSEFFDWCLLFEIKSNKSLY